MPVQLNELVVRATVDASSAPIQKQIFAKEGGKEGADVNPMVAECVEEVLRILNEQHKR
ncbi:MAG: DUF5908 family protein [Bacteroidota bacterium]|nr:DUF5908 family protein [Bacteroidota bacterium]